VLRLIAPGNANKEIADQLSLAEDTVKWCQEHPDFSIEPKFLQEF
jgi:ATP/maltotriose-dependent transcriptional regulator MalT